MASGWVLFGEGCSTDTNRKVGRASEKRTAVVMSVVSSFVPLVLLNLREVICSCVSIACAHARIGGGQKIVGCASIHLQHVGGGTRQVRRRQSTKVRRAGALIMTSHLVDTHRRWINVFDRAIERRFCYLRAVTAQRDVSAFTGWNPVSVSAQH